ncbi:MAG: hypothetical protein ABWX93_03370 [Pseudoxanthomonas sp.]
MERSEAPRISTELEPGKATQARRPGGFPGQLSRTEAFLYNGARCIDRVLDQWQDRPVRSFAVTACVMALVSVIPH